jgi:hypothetical protein
MSWNNVIPAHLLIDTNKLPQTRGVENPLVTIPDELVTDCLIRYKFEGHYDVVAAHRDHPAFDEVRKLLAARGYIAIPEYPCWNGDRVIKRFRFNEFQLEEGDTFYCASAWSGKIAVQRKKVVDIPEQ